MQNTLRIVYAVLIVLGVTASASAQARLTIENHSQRQLTVKVMKVSGIENTLHGTMTVPAMSAQTMSFSETGEYFTKTMATLTGKDPIYQKGQSFMVTVGRQYSVLTLTVTIVESATPQMSIGRRIPKEEFDKDTERR